MSNCKTHEPHDHVHGPDCGHQAILIDAPAKMTIDGNNIVR